MPDYRSEKMDSLEGEGIAGARWRSYRDRVDEKFLELADGGRQLYDSLPEEMQFPEMASTIEVADLAGFWLAWHLGGGFAGLERQGWNRSTVFRKIRRFRAVFDVHPDTYRFSWLRADWEEGWDDYLSRLVALEARQHPSDLSYDLVDDDIVVDDEPLRDED